MPTMKAVRIHSYGGPEVLQFGDTSRPEAAEGEVLIRVLAAGVNPLDWKVRSGYVKGFLRHRFPLILGWDVAGVVEAPGRGVTDFKRGDAVYALLDFTRDGAYAEYAVARSRDVARKPVSIDPVHAAAVPLAALTAWQALFDVAKLEAGQSVLIHGAAGGVGHYAVQLAKWQGAKVIGTASGGNEKALRDLGADEVIDYKTARFEDRVSNADVVLDLIGGDTQQRSWKTLKKGGVLVSTVGGSSTQDLGRPGIRGETMLVHPDTVQLTRIAELIDGGQLKPVVNTALPLAEAARSHELSQSGHVHGKIVLKVSE